MQCPLCHNLDIKEFHRDKVREYLQCKICSLVFVPQKYHLSKQAEKAEYDKHCNSADDPGYRKFLNRLFAPMHMQLSPEAKGLEFGCGPGPALAKMFKEAGCRITLYDKFYFNDKVVLQDNYDFITATEVFEHLSSPATEITQLWKILKPGGILGAMTKLVLDKESFVNWHYTRDLTHISFFSKPTFIWLAEKLNAEVKFHGNDVIILYKSSPA